MNRQPQTSSKSADTETPAIPEKIGTSEQALKMFVVLQLFVITGCSGMDLLGFGNNDTGIVYILYHEILPQSQMPINVNKFLIENGYTPSVVATYYRHNGYSVQKIYLGVDVDPYPLLSGLQAIPGVLSAAREMETDHLRRHPPNGVIDELELD